MKASIICAGVAGAAFLIMEGCTQASGAMSPAPGVAQNAAPEYYASGSRSATTSPSTRVKNPDATTIRGLYVTQAGYGVGSGVWVYNKNYRKNKAPVCSIPMSYPAAVTADALGNLYVVSNPNYTAGPATIFVYKPHCGSLIASVKDSYGYANTIVLHGSTWYVDNLYADSGGYSGNVAVCSKSSGCYADLTVPPSLHLTSELYGAGVDKKGNVYADGYTIDNSNIVLSIFKWSHAQNPAKSIYAADLDGAGGPLIFDNAGNMIIGGLDEYFVITGCPSACVTNGPFGLQGSVQEFALNKNGTRLFAANGHGSVDVYTYNGPNAPTYLYSVTKGLNKSGYGVAVPYAVTPVPANSQ